MPWVSGRWWPRGGPGGRRKPWAQEWLEEAAAYPFSICKEIVILISSLPFSYRLVHLYYPELNWKLFQGTSLTQP